MQAEDLTSFLLFAGLDNQLDNIGDIGQIIMQNCFFRFINFKTWLELRKFFFVINHLLHPFLRKPMLPYHLTVAFRKMQEKL